MISWSMFNNRNLIEKENREHIEKLVEQRCEQLFYFSTRAFNIDFCSVEK